MDHTPVPAVVAGLSAVAARYNALLCDVWGVIHNGVGHFPSAVAALVRFRAAGGIVILITNAPRPAWSVRDQLDGLRVDRRAYDRIVTSGDVAASLIALRGVSAVHHVGPDRDLPLYRDVAVTLVGVDEAALVCCTGLVDDETETAEDYDPLLDRCLRHDLEMICANPDIVVDRGGKLIPCAGAIAERYAAMGGRVTIVGKPLARIYDVALAEIAAVAGRAVETGEILAIGDGAETDIRGANDAGIASLFIASGVHASEYGEETEHILDFLGSREARVMGVMPRLIW
ncbi:MAG: TIGR01459 family HAD-type hydrolase [Bauldia sp.]